MPGFLAAAPCPDRHGNPVILHVDTTGEHQAAGWHLTHRIFLTPGGQSTGVDGVGVLVLPICRALLRSLAPALLWGLCYHYYYGLGLLVHYSL
jgi:multisubunit Na+/H+ antiporter MnhE subunit